jgi:small subunit ribosomal protein S16
MIKIRLTRKGATNNVFYRIVAIEEGKKNSGKVLEILGFWHPKRGVKELNKDKVKEWVSKGAQKSKAIQKLLA